MGRDDDIIIDTNKYDFVKIVYEDNKEAKVVRGWLVDESDFLYKIKAQHDGKIIEIGKRALIKKTVLEEKYDR